MGFTIVNTKKVRSQRPRAGQTQLYWNNCIFSTLSTLPKGTFVHQRPHIAQPEVAGAVAAAVPHAVLPRDLGALEQPLRPRADQPLEEVQLVREAPEGDGDVGGGHDHDAEREAHGEQALSTRAEAPQERLPVPNPSHRLRGSVGQVYTPVSLRTRLTVKNTRGIFK
eukprot:5461996-Pyramimonas_sp.AAC.3